MLLLLLLFLLLLLLLLLAFLPDITINHFQLSDDVMIIDPPETMHSFSTRLGLQWSPVPWTEELLGSQLLQLRSMVIVKMLRHYQLEAISLYYTNILHILDHYRSQTSKSADDVREGQAFIPLCFRPSTIFPSSFRDVM